MSSPLLVTIIALILAYFLGEVARYFKLPRVVGQITAGFILGIPLLKSILITDDVASVFKFLTNIGIILLFFFVGIEINFRQFRSHVRESALISLFNTAVPLLLGLAVGAMFGFELLPSIIIGISIAVSSQAVSLDILEEMNLLKSKIGSLITTAGTVDDVFELMAISTILVVFHVTITGSLKALFLDLIIFTIIIILFRLSLIPFTLKMFERDKSQAVLFMGALIIVLSLAYLSEIFGVSSLVGALIAGVLFRQSMVKQDYIKPWRKNALSNSIHVISFGFLIPIFFVNVGLTTSIQAISGNIPLVLTLLAADIIGTVGGSTIGVLLSKGSVNEGFIVGWGLTPKGDTELVIATLALNSALITLNVYTAIIAVAFITTIISPIVFRILVRKHITVKS